MTAQQITTNRAPVLTLWAAVVAERLGYDRAAALSLGKCVAGFTAQTKGRMLGIYGPGTKHEGAAPGRTKPKSGLGEEFWVVLCGRNVPAVNTDQGVRAVVKDKPADPGKVGTYLEGKFGDAVAAVRQAMAELAEAFEPDALAAAARGLYEQFRPEIPGGRRGWGAKGTLDLDLLRSLAAQGGETDRKKNAR